MQAYSKYNLGLSVVAMTEMEASLYLQQTYQCLPMIFADVNFNFPKLWNLYFLQVMEALLMYVKLSTNGLYEGD